MKNLEKGLLAEGKWLYIIWESRTNDKGWSKYMGKSKHWLYYVIIMANLKNILSKSRVPDHIYISCDEFVV